MYAFYKKLDYFSTECLYAPNAYRGFAREFLKDIEVSSCRAYVLSTYTCVWLSLAPALVRSDLMWVWTWLRRVCGRALYWTSFTPGSRWLSKRSPSECTEALRGIFVIQA